MINSGGKPIPVVIIGAGPAGLALAIELGHRNIECLLIEKNDRVGYAPRAKTTNVRTRTHLRRWGIATNLAQASPFGVDYPSNVLFVTRLSGDLLTRFTDASNCNPRRSPLYPEHGQWIPQYKLEQVLQEHVSTLPAVHARFRTRFVSATQTPDHVLVHIHNIADGTDLTLNCEYFVGADGAHSAVRDVIGAIMHGQSRLSRNYNVVFRARGLEQAHKHGPGTMYWQVNPEAPSLMGPMDKDDVWYFMPTKLPEGVTLRDSDPSRMIALSTGIDLEYEILSTDLWGASSLIADKYGDRRIFLVGDACHQHPPFGGYGMNMGIADSVDLGWKLAAKLLGWGGPRLLSSYEMERRPIHKQVIVEATKNHAVLSNEFWREGLEGKGPGAEQLRSEIGARIHAAKASEFETLATVLGYCYEDSPVIDYDGGGPYPREGNRYFPSSKAGCVTPHAWLKDGSSLYDHLGAGFTLLLSGSVFSSAIDKFRADAAAYDVPLHTFALADGDDVDPYQTAFTLVRPDQHVGWRGNSYKAGLMRHLTGH